MQSPIAPGRISSRRLLNSDRQPNVDGRRPKAHLIVASLIAQLAGHCSGTRLRSIPSFEIGLDVERSGKHGQPFGAHLDLFGLGITDGRCLERAGIPSEFQRYDKLAPWLVAVDVKT